VERPRLLLRAELFSDGTYFDAEAKRFIGSSIDITALARAVVKNLAQPHLLVKVRFCTSPHLQPRSPSGKFWTQYLDRLKLASIIELHLGRHEKNRYSDACGAERYVEKETDVNVVTLMLNGAHQNRYDTAVLFSGDTDLVPAMKAVRELQKHIVWCPFPAQAGLADLERLADDVFPLEEKFLRTLKVLIVHR